MSAQYRDPGSVLNALVDRRGRDIAHCCNALLNECEREIVSISNIRWWATEVFQVPDAQLANFARYVVRHLLENGALAVHAVAGSSPVRWTPIPRFEGVSPETVTELILSLTNEASKEKEFLVWFRKYFD